MCKVSLEFKGTVYGVFERRPGNFPEERGKTLINWVKGLKEPSTNALVRGQEIFRRNRNVESSAKGTVYTSAGQCLVFRTYFRIDRKNSSRVKGTVYTSLLLVGPCLEVTKPSRKGRKSTPLGSIGLKGESTLLQVPAQ
jgi:hypothetical protein